MTHRYIVIGPRTPGAEPSELGRAHTLADARLTARDHHWRRDLCWQDIVIRRADTGRRVEFAGPSGR